MKRMSFKEESRRTTSPKILGLAILMSLTMLGSIVHASEPSALEIRQLQTRIFEVPPPKVLSAMTELCNNAKPGSTPNYAPSILNTNPTLSCAGVSFRGQGPFIVSYSLESEKNSKATRIRMRVQKLEFVRSNVMEWVQSFDSSDYELIYNSLADVLLLNDIGVDVRVYR